MKTLIILNGDLQSEAFLQKLAASCDFIICADGGYDKAKQAGVVPNLLIGDMDSIKSRDFMGEILQFPAEKNWTDCELAIETALERGSDEVVLTCTLGGRYDHAIANIYILTQYENVCIQEADCSIYSCDKEMVLKNKTGKTMSLIPACETVATLRGFKYPVEQTIFSVGSTLGISNIVTEREAAIFVHQGKALIFLNE